MANLQKHRTHESLNIESAAEWSVQSRQKIEDSGTGVDEVIVDVSSYYQIGFYSDINSYIRFDTSASDSVVANNDLIIPSETLAFLNVPRGVGNTIYVHFKGVEASDPAANSYIKLVLM